MCACGKPYLEYLPMGKRNLEKQEYVCPVKECRNFIPLESYLKGIAFINKYYTELSLAK